MIPVESSKTANSVYWSEEIVLLTKDGVGCVGEADVNACFNKKSLTYADIDVLVKDAETL